MMAREAERPPPKRGAVRGGVVPCLLGLALGAFSAIPAVPVPPEAPADPAASTAPPVLPAPGQAGRAMALTFDDLPFVFPGRPGTLAEARRATSEILGVLREHRAPSVGFVNEGKVQVEGEVDGWTDLLRDWIASGAILGNHTYSHTDLNAVTVERFEEEIVRGEAITGSLMAGRGDAPLLFRHPMTHTGDTVAKKQAIEAFLAEHGYRVAPHTVECDDFLFNVGYARAIRGGDRTTASRLREAYLDFTMRRTEFAERVSPRIFGREIPQTLLLHANEINAGALGDLLSRLEKRGYRFVTLQEAMSDPAYATRDTLVTSYGPTWLWRWMKSRNMAVSFRDDPEPPAWVLDLSRPDPPAEAEKEARP